VVNELVNPALQIQGSRELSYLVARRSGRRWALDVVAASTAFRWVDLWTVNSPVLRLQSSRIRGMSFIAKIASLDGSKKRNGWSSFRRRMADVKFLCCSGAGVSAVDGFRPGVWS